jgi:hypothetical protein
MVGNIAPIAEEEDILVISASAYRTGATILLVLEFVFDEGSRVELGNLFLIFNFVFGKYGSCK